MSLGLRIRELRIEQNISGRKLAKRVGVTPGCLWHIEKNLVKNPSMEMLFKIASELNTTLNYLCHGEGNLDLENFDSLPEGMEEFISENRERYDIQNEDVIDLMGIKYRGKQPRTSDGWLHLFNSVRLIAERG